MRICLSSSIFMNPLVTLLPLLRMMHAPWELWYVQNRGQQSNLNCLTSPSLKMSPNYPILLISFAFKKVLLSKVRGNTSNLSWENFLFQNSATFLFFFVFENHLSVSHYRSPLKTCSETFSWQLSEPFKSCPSCHNIRAAEMQNTASAGCSNCV